MYIVARSMEQGRRAGLASMLGIEVGSLIHVIAATLGLSAVLLTSAVAFTIVKYLGAAYLIFLGLRTLLARSSAVGLVEPVAPQALRRLFRHGVLVNVLNPKTALFFFAFLPQFVDPARGSASVQVLMLGLIWLTMATLSDGTYALLAGVVSQWVRGQRGFVRTQRYVAGSAYITLSLAPAFSGLEKK